MICGKTFRISISSHGGSGAYYCADEIVNGNKISDQAMVQFIKSIKGEREISHMPSKDKKNATCCQNRARPHLLRISI